MIVKREKCYIKKVNRIGEKYYGQQVIKQTSYLLLGFIPLYVTKIIIGGSPDSL